MLGRTSLAIECPACGEYTEKPLGWLKSAEIVDCGECGSSIELVHNHYRAQIESLVNRINRPGY